MSETFYISAEPRSDSGTGASRRLRRQGQVPGILYGGGESPQMFSIAHSELLKQLEHEAFYSTLLDLELEGQTTRVVLKDLQRHPAKPFILHIDLQRVSQHETLRMTVPVHFDHEDTCKGVKLGGKIAHNITELEILCLPADLPEFIAIDMSEMAIGDTLHVRELVLPAGVELAHGTDLDAPVVQVLSGYGGSDADDEQEGATEDDS